VTPVERVNYIRNSVKATVDAYHGSVELYVWDEQDPVLKTWRKAFPGTVQNRDKISADLMDHLRYPEDLFKVQRTLLARYHEGNPRSFYSGSDFWRVPVDPTQANAGLQPPYYVTLQMPGQTEQAFSLTSTYVPTGDRNNLAAFVAVNADPGPDYGQFRVLELPRSLQINGPSQVQNQLESEDTIAEEINILKRGTKVLFGNLLTLPVGGGLLYVEPVYVQADASTSFPLLRKVLVSFGNDVAFEDTLEEALDSLFADQGGVSGGEPTEPDPGGEPSAPGGTVDQNAALTRALADAQDAIQAAEEALTGGDFTAYGQAQQDLRDAIDRAVRAQRAGGERYGPDEARLQLDGRVGDARIELGVDSATHRGVEDRRHDPPVHGPERVVVLLARLVGEDDEARGDECRREAHEVGDRRWRQLVAGDPMQELEPGQLVGRGE